MRRDVRRRRSGDDLGQPKVPSAVLKHCPDRFSGEPLTPEVSQQGVLDLGFRLPARMDDSAEARNHPELTVHQR